MCVLFGLLVVGLIYCALIKVYEDYLPIVSGRHQSPFTHHPSPVSRHPQPVTRHPPPATRGKVLPMNTHAFKIFLFHSTKNVSIVVENCLGTSKHNFIPMLSPTYDALMPRQFRLETKSFMSEISGKNTKMIAWQSSPSKRSKAYGAISKARLFSAPVGGDTNISLQDRYS